MKKYDFNRETEFSMFVGTDREIRSLYSELLKRHYAPTFCNFPKFRKGSLYGLMFEWSDYFQTFEFSVVNAETALGIITGC